MNIKLNKEVLLSDEFNQLWNQIKYKTTYSVDLDSDTLKSRCIDAIQKLDDLRLGKLNEKMPY